jgi:hypothetical protein
MRRDPVASIHRTFHALSVVEHKFSERAAGPNNAKSLAESNLPTISFSTKQKYQHAGFQCPLVISRREPTRGTKSRTKLPADSSPTQSRSNTNNGVATYFAVCECMNLLFRPPCLSEPLCATMFRDFANIQCPLVFCSMSEGSQRSFAAALAELDAVTNLTIKDNTERRYILVAITLKSTAPSQKRAACQACCVYV